jgi:SM-20-related protein
VPFENTHKNQSVLMSSICDDLISKSYSVQHNALPKQLINLLSEYVTGEDGPTYVTAGIGRSRSHHKDQNIRRDKISWIDDKNATDQRWNNWTETLRVALNRQLFMGLIPIESHYARYETDGFYKKHLDAFTGDGNRKVSIVLFLNDQWQEKDEGKLVLYGGLEHDEQIFVSPKQGTLAVFLSTEISHEVLRTNCTRNSIAGWYR